MKTTAMFSVLVIMILQLQGSECKYFRIMSQELMEPAELSLTKTDVTQHPQDKTVLPDEDVELSCVFSAAPVYCGWTHNGMIFAPMAGAQIEYTGNNSAGDCSIRINQILLGNSGDYQCSFPETAPGNGAMSKIAKVTVLDQPDSIEIVDYASGADLILFETGNKITCTAKDGNPAASLTWFVSNPTGYEELDGTSTVEPGTTLPLETAVNELVLDAADELDHEELMCEAKHSTLPVPLSTSVVLRIAKPVTIATASFEEIPSKTDISIPTGSTITMICTADGYPLADYSWAKKNTTDGSWPAFSAQQNITDIAQDGQFVCIAGNSKYPAGKSSNLLKITLTGILGVVEHPQNSAASLGEDLQLNCKFDAGVVSCNWFKDDTSLSPNNYIFNGDTTTGNCAIILPNMQVNQDGKYYCEAATVKSQEATVTVQQAPKSPVLIFENSEVPENSIIHAPSGPQQISCRAESGKPVANITWTQNDVPATGTPMTGADVDNPLLTTITSTILVALSENEPSIHVVCRSSHPAYPPPGYKEATVTFQYTEPPKHI